MIAYYDGRCASCLCFATRVTLDEWGDRLALCDRCPSPSEIELQTAEIRAKWDEIEHWCRRYGMSREAALDSKGLRIPETSVVHPQLPLCRARSATPVEL